MKYIIMLLITVSLACSASNSTYQTAESIYNSKLDYFFAGKHNLLSLNNFNATTSKSTTNGYFFVVIGDFNSASETSTSKMVRFSWLNISNEYVMAEMPINKVRFVIDNKLITPYVKFKWAYWRHERNVDEQNWQKYVIYVVFTIRPEQISNDTIKLNLK